MKPYDHHEIETKWQARWESEQAFVTPELAEDEHGTFVLPMFPYPSGSGLHVGHLLCYAGTDIVARTARMQGKKVLHTIGWDSFGLPAENYALKTGVHPAISTPENVANYRRQFRAAGISYDWNKEMNTSDPAFYKWTQWLFTFLYERGLAYKKQGMVNWCPKDQTVLANEQVVGGKCERCGTEVIQKNLEQWYFKVTDFADRLLDDLETVDWPEKIKTIQRNWIGKSEGARLTFKTKDGHNIEVFTTRPDTIFGATYLVLAPEHELVEILTTPEQLHVVKQYQADTKKKTELERLHLDKTKSGAWTGATVIHPLTEQEIPVWIGDYVLSTYGTGAVMAVPAHDERDFAFATMFNLPIIQSVGEPSIELPYLGKGPLLNAGEYTGKHSEDILDELLTKMDGKRETTFRLRDWLVSRQFPFHTRKLVKLSLFHKISCLLYYQTMWHFPLPVSPLCLLQLRGENISTQKAASRLVVNLILLIRLFVQVGITYGSRIHHIVKGLLILKCSRNGFLLILILVVWSMQYYTCCMHVLSPRHSLMLV
jgi:leucyl-tRNA synthetase